jgi:hypothetical protein
VDVIEGQVAEHHVERRPAPARRKIGMPPYPPSTPYLARSRLMSLSVPATAADHPQRPA